MKMNLKMLGVLSGTMCALTLTVGVGTHAQRGSHQKHRHYKLIDMGTFGGPQSYVNPGSGNDAANFAQVLNQAGDVAGSADIPVPDPFPTFCFSDDCFESHAFEWKNGVKTDLGALPGGASSAANWISANGIIAGLSENGEIDPLIPNFPELHGTVWTNGHIVDLGTLPEGGFESSANAVNSRGQVVGLALNTVQDDTSMLGLGFQTRAFLWQKGTMQDLGTLGGTNAQAFLINERGQVVGVSYLNSVPTSACLQGFAFATGSFIWDKEHGMRDLGNLGGTCTIANDMNERGEIVGASNLAGDQSQHAFLWDKGSFQDLGGSLGGLFQAPFALNEQGQAVGFATLTGDIFFHAVLWKQVGQLTDLGVIGSDQCSYATSINEAMQVVGGSISACGTELSGFRAFLWEDGSLADLNALIPANSSLQLQFTETINNRGEIAGTGVDKQNNQHAFLALPCDGNHPKLEGCDYSLVDLSDTETSTVSNSDQQGASLLNSSGAGTSQTAPGVGSTFELDKNPVSRFFRRRSGLAGGPKIRRASVEGTSTTAILAIASGTPPSGRVGKLYDVRCSSPYHCTPILAGYSLAAAGGVPPYTWSWAGAQGSSTPPGLYLWSFGNTLACTVKAPAICGTPTLAGTYNVIVTVRDSSKPSNHASAAYTITVFQQ